MQELLVLLLLQAVKNGVELHAYGPLPKLTGGQWTVSAAIETFNRSNPYVLITDIDELNVYLQFLTRKPSLKV